MKIVAALALAAGAAAQIDLTSYLALQGLGHRGGLFGGRFGGHGGSMLPMLALGGGAGLSGLTSGPLGDMLVMDGINRMSYYGGGFGQMLPMLALGGNDLGLGPGVRDMLILDEFGGYRGGFMGDYLPAAILSGADTGLGLSGNPINQMWAMDRMTGGRGEFRELIPMYTAGIDSQFLATHNAFGGHGGRSPIALAAATGTDLSHLGPAGLMMLGGHGAGHRVYAPHRRPMMRAAPAAAAPAAAAAEEDGSGSE